MERTHEDQWTSNPLTVKSFFRFNPSSLSDGDSITSPLCGLGWRYLCDKQNRKRVFPFRTQLCFSPGRLLGASLLRCNLAISMTASGHDSAYQLGVSFQREFNWIEEFSLAGIKQADFVFSLQFPADINVSALSSSDPKHHLPNSTQGDELLDFKKLLRDSFQGDELLDFKFWLFSERSSEGFATCPKPIYASSRFFRGRSEYLDTLTSLSGFAESVLVDIDSSDGHRDLRPEDFTHYEDSDLESEDGDEVSEVEGPEIAGNSSDIVIPKYPGQRDTKIHMLDSPSKKIVRYGRVIALNDTAFRTFKALLWYLYTKEITFVPLHSLSKSSKKPKKPTEFSCSPKSMYRLAHEFEIEELETLALAKIKSDLRESNVVEEFASQLASSHQPIRDIAIDFMIENFTPTVQRDFNDLWKSAPGSDLPRLDHDVFMDVVLKLYQRFSQKEIIDLAQSNASSDDAKKVEVVLQWRGGT